MPETTLASFTQRIAQITSAIADKPVDEALQTYLNEQFPPSSELFQQIQQDCLQAEADGWMCQHEHGGIRYGRVIKPSEAIHGFSVDVVRMRDIKGPHHRHPNGEIDMVMPTDGDADFDGQPAGWKVYAPDSAHHPTVSNGEALVLYLLPEGAIEFTRG
jgi:hypothetical protein